jgi:hypothetical protein
MDDELDDLRQRLNEAAALYVKKPSDDEDEAHNSREGALAALGSVLDYIRDYTEPDQRAPLLELMAALYDVKEGRKLSPLFIQPEKRKHTPSNEAFHEVLASCIVTLLINSEAVSLDNACLRVARAYPELDISGKSLKNKRKAISACRGEPGLFILYEKWLSDGTAAEKKSTITL